MPDELEQVAEPETTEQTTEAEDILKNETDAFESESDEPEKPEETIIPEEPEEKTEETDEESDESEESEESGEEESEEDEDVKRGKEILAEKQAAEEAQKKQDETQDSDEPDDLRKESFDNETIGKLASYLPKNLLPGTAKLEDGTELDFKTVLSDYPEIPHIIAAYTNNIIRQMVGSGFLVSDEALNNFGQKFDQKSYVRTVTHPQYGVPQAGNIINSDEYKSWVEKQPAEIQALRESGNPFDMIRVIKRFQNQGILDDAKKKAEEHDEKRREKKKTFDAVHKTAKKRTPTKPKTEIIDGKAQEMEAFLSDEDE